MYKNNGTCCLIFLITTEMRHLFDACWLLGFSFLRCLFMSFALEAATEYFLIQATASMLLILAITLNLITSRQWAITKIYNTAPSTIITVAMAIKLGIAPFHFWVPEGWAISLFSMTIEVLIYIFWIQIFCCLCASKYFYPVRGMLFHSFWWLDEQKFYILM